MQPDIDATNDFAFKRLFADEAKPRLCKALLNAILAKCESQPIFELAIHTPVKEREFAQDKLTQFDVRVRDSGNRDFLMEIQRLVPWEFGRRVVYYCSVTYGAQLRIGEVYLTLRPVMAVAFLLENLNDKPRWFSEYLFRETTTGEVLCEDIRIVFVELEKFHLQVDEIKTDLERWCYFLKHAQELDTEALPATLNTPDMRLAMEVLMNIRLKQDDFDQYLAEAQAQMERASRDYAHKNAHKLFEEKGRKEGLDAGRKEGLDEGRKEGLKRGMVGQIHLVQRLLGVAQTPEADLLALPLPELQKLASELEAAMLARASGKA